jgi:hypothetical protein
LYLDLQAGVLGVGLLFLSAAFAFVALSSTEVSAAITAKEGDPSIIYC